MLCGTSRKFLDLISWNLLAETKDSITWPLQAARSREYYTPARWVLQAGTDQSNKWDRANLIGCIWLLPEKSLMRLETALDAALLMLSFDSTDSWNRMHLRGGSDGQIL